jgi:arylsulfatase
MAPRILVAFVCFLTACGSPQSDAGGDASRPNILLLVADDLGYADLGSYGGDISTPNMDAIAARGIRFSQFHTAPMCAPTRAMLLSGNDNHVAGMGVQGGAPPFARGLPGYERHLSDRIVPFPQLLQDAGYQTYSVGKWHLGTEPEHTPTAAGFDRSFQLLQGAGDHFSNVALSGNDSVSTYWVDGEYGEWPEGSYDTELYTDRLMDFIRDGLEDGRPFFAYTAFTSPHWPLQVPEEYRDLYRGRYDMGYDRLRELRLESLKEVGMVSADHQLPPPVEGVTRWEDLSAEQQRKESRKMELYAAMVDNLDFHVGRIVGLLEEEGILDNTLIFLISDNGAAAEDFYNVGGFVPWLQRNFDNSYEKMGTPESYVSYGPQWADAGSAPFRGHKQHATEGGIVAPMIVAGPGIDAAGSIESGYAGVMDLAPTFLELAGASYPGSRGTSLTTPMSGKSILPLLAGDVDEVHGESEVLALSHGAVSFLRIGDWKLVTNTQYAGDETFRLYDLGSDPAESTDVSERYPERRAELLDSLQAFRARVGVALPDAGGR